MTIDAQANRCGGVRGVGRVGGPSRLDARRSGRSRRRPISSRVTSRTCRSTATAASSSARSTAQVAETSAPFLWTVLAGGRRHAVGRHRQRRTGARRSRRDGKTSTFFDAAEMEVHALAPAPNGGLYVAHLARRQDLPGRGRRHVEDVLRSRRQATSGRSPRRRTAHCSPPPARRATSTASRPTARDRSSTRRTPPTSWRWPSTRAATSSPGPNRPDGSSASTRTPRRSCWSTRRSRRSTR